MTTMHRTTMWPGLNFILLLYSSKYLTKPPIPEGMLILSCAILSKTTLYYQGGTQILFSGSAKIKDFRGVRKFLISDIWSCSKIVSIYYEICDFRHSKSKGQHKPPFVRPLCIILQARAHFEFAHINAIACLSIKLSVFNRLAPAGAHRFIHSSKTSIG